MIKSEQSTGDKVSLNACWNGLWGDVAYTSFWAIFLTGLLYGANLIRWWLYGNYQASTFDQFKEAPGRLTLLEFALAMGAIIACIVTVALLIAIVCDFVNVFYAVKRKVVIDKDARLIVVTKHTFPFSKEQIQISFDRIIKVSVKQGLIDRLVNTGDIYITVITNANADSVEMKVWAPDIVDPYGSRDLILNGITEYKGLKLDFY